MTGFSSYLKVCNRFLAVSHLYTKEITIVSNPETLILGFPVSWKNLNGRWYDPQFLLSGRKGEKAIL